MGHIVIIGSFIVFVLGLWTISYIYYLRKEYFYEFLNSFLGIIIIHNIMMIWDLVRFYIAVNLTTNDNAFQSPFWGQATQPIISYLTIVVNLLIVKLLFQLSGTKIHLIVRKVIFVIFILYTLSHLIRIATIYYGSDLILLQDFHLYFHIVVSDLASLILLYFIIMNFFGKKTSRNPINGICSLFYLLFLLLCTFPIVRSIPGYIYYMTILMSLFNIFPFIWIKYFFLPRNLHLLKLNGFNEALDSIIVETKISQREKEIVELILQGKSNQQIEEELFISVSTVKNHLYRIYKKFGVSSRGQLVNLILKKQIKQKE